MLLRRLLWCVIIFHSISMCSQLPEIVFSAQLGFDHIVERLAQSGADLNVTESLFGGTALHWAAYHGNECIVQCLVNKGADIGVRCKEQATPLYWGAKSSTRVVRILLNAARARGMYDYVNVQDKAGNTPLGKAVKANRPDLVALLLAYGANPNICNRAGICPFVIAVRDKNIRILDLLVRKGQKNIDVRQPGLPGMIPLFFLLFQVQIADGDTRLLDVARTWIQHGANAHRTFSPNQLTLMHYAASVGNTSWISLLLEAGMSPDVRSKEGCTSALTAIKNQQFRSLRALFQVGACSDYCFSWFVHYVTRAVILREYWGSKYQQVLSRYSAIFRELANFGVVMPEALVRQIIPILGRQIIIDPLELSRVITYHNVVALAKNNGFKLPHDIERLLATFIQSRIEPSAQHATGGERPSKRRRRA